MKTRTAFVALTLALLAGCKQAPMTDYTSEEGKFKCKFPGAPTVSSHAAAGMTLKMYLVESWSGGYMIGYADVPIPAGESVTKTQMRLDDARNGAIKAIGGTPKSSQVVMLQGKYQGQEFTGEGSGRHVRARAFLVGRRLYQLVVAGRSESFLTTPEADDFFNFFQVLDGTPVIPEIPAGPAASDAVPEADPAVVINSKSGRFKARFPFDPKRSTRTFDGHSFTLYASESKAGTSAAGFADVSGGAAESPKKPQERLDALHAAVVKSINGTAGEGQPLTLSGGHPGSEFSAEGDGQHLRGRVYLVGNRLYLLTVQGSASYVNGAEANAFLDSFQVTN